MGIVKSKKVIREKKKKIPNKIENKNSLFVILGINEISKNRNMSLPGVIKDIANLKRLFLSENIGFSENNILTLLNIEKEKIIDTLNKKIQSRDWDNIILYYTGFGAMNENKEFYITCKGSEFGDLKTMITAKEIGSLFQETISNIILIFDCCNAQGVFKYLYNKDVFLLGAASETGYAKDTSEGGLFTNQLVEVLMNGIENEKEFLSLNDLYLELRKRLVEIQEPEMLTTNIVQHQIEIQESNREND